MLEAAISAMGWTVSNYLVAGVAPEPMGDQNATAAPSGTFDAADGPLNIAANRQEQFEALCRRGGPARADQRPPVRRPGGPQAQPRRAQRRAEPGAARADGRWSGSRRCTAAGVPAARILTVPQAVGLDQLAHRGFFTDLPLPDDSGKVLRVSGNGVLVDGEPLRPGGPPPLLGQHNAERGLADHWRVTRRAS